MNYITKIFQVPTDIKLLTYSFLLPTMPVFLGILFLHFVGNTIEDFIPDFETFFMVLTTTIWIFPFEEIPWRGYALPKLLSITTPSRASTILGIIISLRHLPLFFYAPPYLIQDWDNFLMFYCFYIISNILLNHFMTWLWEKSGGNLLLMVIFHSVYAASVSCFKMKYSSGFIYISLMQLFMLMYHRLNEGVKEVNMNYSTKKVIDIQG